MGYDSESQKARVYVGRKLVRSESSVPPPTATTRHLLIGASGTHQFNGSLDDVRVYDRALSDEEVRSLAAGLE